MSQLLLLLIFAVWLVPLEAIARPVDLPRGVAVGMFLGGYAALVLALAAVCRIALRWLHRPNSRRWVRAFNIAMLTARWLVPAWLAAGVIFGGWEAIIADLVRVPGYPLVLPSLVLGVLPSLATWVALTWAAYPADRAIREQNLLVLLEENLPVHSPPSLGKHLMVTIRQHLLFVALPLILIFAIRDGSYVVFRLAGSKVWPETGVMLAAFAAVYVFSPEILRRVLRTRPLPNGPLRRRLDAVCRRMGLRYREILLWQTDFAMCNAAVMGIIPQLRYVLLSDLLLETMTDQQVEAVFAHEAGHIVHRHLAWYVAFFVMLTLVEVGLDRALAGIPRQFEQYAAVGGAMVSFAAVFGLFGFLSRRCERQADVFAARMIESNWGMNGSPDGPQEPSQLSGDSPSHVGEKGAATFGSALSRVATVNSIPEEARSWRHGSIARRRRYLLSLSAHPQRTWQFDRSMRWLYAGLAVALIASGAWAAMANM